MLRSFRPFRARDARTSALQPRRPLARRSLLHLEQLEDRVVPTVDYPTLYGDVKDFFDKAEGYLNTATSLATAKIPIVDKSFADLTGGNNAIKAIKDGLAKAESVIKALDPDSFANEVADVIDQHLRTNDPQQGVNILRKDAQVSIDRNSIDIKLDFGQNITVLDQDFGLALPGLPIRTDGKVQVTVGWELPVELGLDLDGNPFFNVDKLSFDIGAGIAQNSTLTGNLGFLYFSANVNQLGFSGHLDVPLSDPGSHELQLGTPKLSGAADVDLGLKAAFSQDTSAPSIAAEFKLHWGFDTNDVTKNDSSFGGSKSDDFTAGFSNITFDFGHYLSDIVKPVAEKVQQLTAPIKPFIDFVTAPVPVISDLAEFLGDKDGVTILDIVGIVNNSGKIPEPYSTYVTLASEIIKITKLIDEFDLSGASVQIPIDDINLVGSQSKDLRDLDLDSDFLNPDKLDWSHLDALTPKIDQVADGIKQKIHDACYGVNDTVGGLGDQIISAIDSLKQKYHDATASHIDWEYPILDDPTAAIGNLLIGRDADLVKFEAVLKLGDANQAPTPGFDMPGFHVGLQGHLSINAKIGLGVDTHGLREVVSDLQKGQGLHPLKLLDGNYVTDDSHLDIGVGLSLTAGFSYIALNANATLNLNANAHIGIVAGADKPQGNDPPDHRIHLDEIPSDLDKLFNISGQITGGLHAEAKIGIGPFSVGPSIDIGPATLASFNIGKINPFSAPDGIALASVDGTGKLTLNIGPNMIHRHFALGNIDENYLVSHEEPKSGDTGETVDVTAFGITQTFHGVTSIYGVSGIGNDTITVTSDVVSPVELHGGAGIDHLKATGTGLTRLYGDGDNDFLTAGKGDGVHDNVLDGGAGDDHLTAGDGSVTMHGGDGKDVLQGGAGHNSLFGDAGRDVLIGGSGLNHLDGGVDDDHLVAGPGADTLSGGAGNDYLEAGAHTASINGGIGADQVIWNFQDQVDGNIVLATPVTINGGGGRDRFAIFGSTSADVFMLAKPAANPNLVSLTAGNASGAVVNIQFQNMEAIDLEGRGGADNITVDDLTLSQVDGVFVNVDDVLSAKSGKDDNAVDHVVINGTPLDDQIAVASVDEKIQITRDEHTILGGFTKITGFPRYDIRVGNLADDLRIRLLDGNDSATVTGITGPTTIYGNGKELPAGNDDDTFDVVAATPTSFTTGLAIDAGPGSNKLHVTQSPQDSFTLSDSQVTSTVLHTLSYVASGGTFAKGVTLTTGGGADQVNVTSTLAGVHTRVETGAGIDDVFVGSGPNGSLAGIQGPLSINTGANTNTLTLCDAAAVTGNQNVALHLNQVLGFAGPTDNTAIDFQGQLKLHLLASDAPALAEHFVLDKPSAEVTLDTGAGDHTVDVLGLVHPATINAGSGADTVNAGFSSHKLDGLQGALLFNAGGGADVLNVADQATGAGRVYLLTGTTLGRSGASPIGFDANLETVHLLTSSFNDKISLGDTGSKTVTIDAGQGTDRLTGPGIASVWTVDGTNAGTVNANVGFANVENLTGGANTDRFVLRNSQHVTGTIDGGGGQDELDVSADTAPVTVDLQTHKITGAQVQAFQAIESFVGGTTTHGTLNGPDLPGAYQIDGVDQGHLNTLGAGNFLFRGFENLTGGSQFDTFFFATAGQLTGKLDGGDGVDKLDYSAVTDAVNVDLGHGLASRVAQVANIENVTGGAGNDTLLGDGHNNRLDGSAGNDVLVGGLGNDTLLGGIGRDLLIGGKGSDTLSGGADEDILVGTSTAHDADAAALAAVMAEWTSGNDYQTRVDHLRGPHGGKNGTTFLQAATVHDDAAKDTLDGGADASDWFWKFAGINGDVIADLQPHELVN